MQIFDPVHASTVCAHVREATVCSEPRFEENAFVSVTSSFFLFFNHLSSWSLSKVSSMNAYDNVENYRRYIIVPCAFVINIQLKCIYKYTCVTQISTFRNIICIYSHHTEYYKDGGLASWGDESRSLGSAMFGHAMTSFFVCLKKNIYIAYGSASWHLFFFFF